MLVGYVTIPAVMSRAGRKVALQVVTLIMLVGWLNIILATNYKVIQVGNIFQELAFGMFMPLCSIVIGEWTSPVYRGSFLATIFLAQSFGFFFVRLLGSLVSYQITACASMLFAAISINLTIYSPESPSWLATRGQYEKCRRNFILLRGEDETAELEKMIQSIKQLKEQNQEPNKIRGMLAVVKKKEFYKPILLMLGLYIMYSYADAGIVAMEILVPFQDFHIQDYINDFILALHCHDLFFSVVAIFVIHKVLFSVGALCAGCQLVMAGYVFAKYREMLPFESLWIPGILLNLHVVTVYIGMQPLPIVIAGEVLPLHHRSLAGSVALVARESIFRVLESFPSLTFVVGSQVALVLYTGIITACLGVAWVLLPETSGRTLQQIEDHFRGDPIQDREEDIKEMKLLKESEEN